MKIKYQEETLTHIVQLISEHLKILDQDGAPATRFNAIEGLSEKFPMPPKEGAPEKLLPLVKEYLEYSTHLQSEQYIGHQTALPSLGSMVADLVLGSINNSVAVFDMAPTGIHVENRVIDWMITQLGWDPNQSSGVLTHGGSLATLTAMLAARAVKRPHAWESGVDTHDAILVPDISHYSLARAVSIMGFGQQAVYAVPTDASGKIRVEEIPSVIQKAKQDGRHPFLICANAASTVTGNYDAFESIRAMANQFDLWLHIDGAHGASAILSDKFRHLAQGIAYADSVVWDAHKLLRCSSLCAGVLFRNKAHRAKTFAQEVTYLREDPAQPSGFFPYTLECTKPAIGLKLYLTLLLEGEVSLGKHVTQLFEKAKEFQQYIKERPNFEAPILPESNILLFRYTNSRSQKEVYEKVLKGGRFHISFTHFHGEEFLRLTIMNPKTNVQTLNQLLDAVESLG